MPYNLTGIMDNSTTVLGFTQGVNDSLLLGYGGTMFLIGFTTIVFLAFYFSTGDVKKALGGTSFIAFGVSIMLRAINLIPNLALYVALVACAASIAFAWRQ